MAASKLIGIWLVAVLFAGPAAAGEAPTDVGYGIGGTPNGIAADALGKIWVTLSDQDRIRVLTPAKDYMYKDFDVPTPPNYLGSIALAADGNLWFTEAHAIGRITPDGTITEFPLATQASMPGNITAGPDGNMWFTELSFSRGFSGGVIGRITPSGTISEFVVATPTNVITRGPDNALWYSTIGIGRITPGGQSRTFDIHGEAIGITAGPDGALWYTTESRKSVGRITTTGESSEIPDITGDSGLVPQMIIRGPDDNLWFTTDAGGIWRLNLAGTAEEMVFLRGNDVARDLTFSPDGGLWYTQPQASYIGRAAILRFNALNLPGAAPLGLAHGADDSVWFADFGGNRIGRIGANSSLVQYELGGGHSPTAIVVGADDTAWFTNPEAETIGHVTVEGEIVEFAIPSPPSNPQDITLGPDGNFWFTEYDAGSVGRITPQGVIKRFPITAAGQAVDGQPRGPTTAGCAYNIAVGADGNLWFTDDCLNKIGRMTTSGEVVEFPIPTADSSPSGIAAGGDGNLYFTEYGAGRVARITTSGVVTELGTPDPESYPEYITLGPDGAMWFTENGTNRLGRIARDGRITKFVLPDSDSAPTGIVGRSDGALFVALLNRSQIAYTYLAAAEPTRSVTPTSSMSPTPTPKSFCDGDCNQDFFVSFSELIDAVRVALGSAPVSICERADSNDDGAVTIDELILAVNSTRSRCLPP